MNIKKFAALVLAASVTFLSACNSQPQPPAETSATTLAVTETTTQAETTTKPTTTAKPTTTKPATTVAKTTAKSTEPSTAYLNERSGKSFLIRKPAFETHRNMLPAKLQKKYDEFWEKISNYEFFVADFKTDDYTIDDFYEITDALRMDYTEIRLFLETSELYSDEMYRGESRYISVDYDYNWLIRDTFDPEYMNSYIDEINTVCDEIISRMPNGTCAEKYEFLGREICKMTEYGENDTDNVPKEEVDWSYAYMNGPLLYGKAICQGYAYAYMYLCNRAGLWCHTVSGGVHCWNIVKLEDGSTYHVDLTWGDTGNDFDRYFLLTQEELEVDHTLYEGEMEANGKPLKKKDSE